MRAIVKAGFLSLALLSAACGPYNGRVPYPTTTESLPLERVVLYRNGVGYFERHGPVEGNVLRIKVRKDQINDLLKSLTVVDKSTGKAVSVSMPLDPETWANAALATLAPRNGSLAEVLDLLRGVDVSLDTVSGSVDGRIVMVERIVEEPDPEAAAARTRDGGAALGTDHKITLMDENELRVVRLSKVKNVTLKDGDLAMQFHRRLDATAGEGMFQQVEVAIRLEGVEDHDLVVSYVVAAPMWKPTYRVVLPKDGKGQALLQAWAVVDNVSGEDWSNVRLSLTAGAPIAFQYDMHSPRHVDRPDISDRVHARRARVAMGETSYDEEEKEAPAPDAEPEELAAADKGWREAGGPMAGGAGQAAPPAATPAREGRAKSKKAEVNSRAYDDGYDGDERADEPSVTMEGLRRSTLAMTKAKQASGLTRYEIGTPVTVPDGSSTMVALVNAPVVGEEVFMFDPNGGGGPGYEQNPFRVVRFKNSTPFVLESGPISIYSGGSFVGEGISEAVGANTSVTVPFAVEPTILVTSETPAVPQELKLLKIVRGTVHAERFYRHKTVWNVKAQNMPDGYKVLIRHPKQGGSYKLKDKIEGLEEIGEAYLVPVTVTKGKTTGSVEVIEQTPSQVTIGIYEADFLGMLERALVAENFSAEERAQLKPLIELRREIGKLDTQIDSLRTREDTLNRRIAQHRYNLDRLKDMKGAEAEKMRQERARQLEQFTKDGDLLAQEIIKTEEKKGQLVIQLEEKLAVLTIGGN
jgi:hypothetical protein